MEEIIEALPKGPVGTVEVKTAAKPKAITNISTQIESRIQLSDNELNRVLGNGLVRGSATLFGGEPGIGKSTLLLQLALNNPTLKVLYVSGEESEQQIKMRAERIGTLSDNCLVLSETNTQNLFKQIEQVRPDVIIIDSIQTLHTSYIESSPGSISQMRECASEMVRFAKASDIPVFLIGHITKEGVLAGPKILEHMVDTVLQFEGDRNHVFRLVRSIKNRFGSTNELGIYEMRGNGLREVQNPSELLITQRDEELSGIAVASTMEGIRPMLIEIQALVGSAAYGTPQRSATGFDIRRLGMLLAVLEKRCGFKLASKDVFLNLAGGVRVDDPGIDLAVVCAVLSSNVDVAIAKNIVFAAEVGLSGEIRPVSRIEQRISEAQKMGYEKIIVSKYNKGLNTKAYNVEVVQVGKIEEAFSGLFG